MIRFQLYFKARIWPAIAMLCASAALLAGCNLPGPARTQRATDVPPQLASTQADTQIAPTVETPTDTPLPLAARVGSDEITLPEYQAGQTQFQAANGGAELSPEDKQRVLDDLIDQSLLAQAAQEKGFQLGEAELQARLDALAEQAGGEAGLSAWMQANGYDADTFRRSLRRQVSAAWMRDQIITEVPTAGEQVHARQILIYNADEANEVYAQLQAGSSFANLAVQYDPVARGDLGWFPRGYLTDPKLDEVVFALEINQYTPVIETAAGYHILQALDRDPARSLSPEALLLAQSRAVQEWLQQARSAGQIEILLP
jgi:peptidyl-prolyl cis-trans isomerase C